MTAPTAPQPGDVTVTHTVHADMIDTSTGRAIHDATTHNPHRVKVRMSYRSADPYAVAFVFLNRESPVEWVFARSLLNEGLLNPAGEGDVKIQPCSRDAYSVILSLASPNGAAAMRFDIQELQDFLAETYEVVAEDDEDEPTDWDAAFIEMTSGE